MMASLAVFTYSFLLELSACTVMVGHRQVVDGQVVIRRPPDVYRPAPDRHFLDQSAFKHQAELRHATFLLRSRFRPHVSAPPGATMKTNPWTPRRRAPRLR